MIDLFSDLFQAVFEYTADWLFAPSRAATTMVPTVTGYSVEQGGRVLAEYDLIMRVAGAAAEPSASVIMSQKPKPGKRVRRGSAVTVRAA